MGKPIQITDVETISEGRIREIKVNGNAIALTKIDGIYFAFEASCTHAQCALAGGYLDGNVVTCYCHGAQFDVRTGRVLAPPATVPLKTYKVHKVKGKLFIEI